MSSVQSAGLAAGMGIHPPGKSSQPDAMAGTPLPQPTAEDRVDVSSDARQQEALAATLDASAQLMDPAVWGAMQAWTNRPDLIHATAAMGATSGEYELNIDQLASSQAVTSAVFSGLGTTIGLGTLNIDVGSWSGPNSAFVTNPNWPRAAVWTGPKDTTLERVRDRINAAGVGVMAMVISDATGSRLILRAAATGTAHAFKVTPEADPANLPDADTGIDLGELGFDPSLNEQGMQLAQPAQDAWIRVDDRTLSGSSNVVHDSESGITLQLKGLTQEPLTLHVAPDPDAAVEATSQLVDTFNRLARQTPSDTAPSPVQAMALAMAQPIGHSTLGDELAEVGLTQDADGSLSLDTDLLQEQVEQDPEAVQNLLAGPEGLASRLATRLSDWANHMLESGSNANNAPPTSTYGTAPLGMASAAARRRMLNEYRSVEANTTSFDTNEP